MRIPIRSRLLITTAILTTLVLPSPVYATTYTSTPSPIAIVTSKGGIGGQSVGAMKVLDQSGTQDIPTKYVTFTTPGTVYNGYQRFVLPLTIHSNAVLSVSVLINFKGALKSKQAWTWSLYDWTASRWVKVGDNAVVTSPNWTYMTFGASAPRRFIHSGSGEIRLELMSSNSTGDAKIDYSAIQIGYSAPPAPNIAGCTIFPAGNFWNVPIDQLPLHPHSADWVNAIGSTTKFHADFGSGTWDGGPIGIPYNIVSGSQTKVPVDFYYPDESDPGPYPLADAALREYGSDHHILIVDQDNCILYELYDASQSSGGWTAGSGAIWSLNSSALRPAGWTSADLAGLAMLPGLIRYDELAGGQINHAIRFTADNHAQGYIWPARHPTPSLQGKYKTLKLPPMGARFRLKASYSIPASTPATVKIILQAMKKYGIVLADTGSPWYLGGVPDIRWNNDDLHWLDSNLQGKYLEAVDTLPLMVNNHSGQAQP